MLRPSSVRAEPIIIVCSGYSRFIDTLILSSIIGLVVVGVPSGLETITISSGTTCNFLTPGLLIIPLYGDHDLTTMKFIQAEAECSSSPIVTNNCICPIGHIISPLNPINRVLAGINWLLISGRIRLKQCSYKIFEADPPSTYMRCIQWPPIYASMIIGPFVPHLPLGVGKRSLDLERSSA
ncbi:hypothetical protein Tco_1010484 [Tanacetum coccineum]